MMITETISAAHHALQRGDYVQSEQLYRSILQDEPENLCALDGLGIIHCQKGETDEGIALFIKALHLLRKQEERNNSWESSLLFHLGLTYRTLGERQKALEVLSIAVQLTPEHHDLLLNRGQIHFELEQYSEAADTFRTLTALDPTDSSAWLTLGYILSLLDKHDEAAEVLQVAETLDSTSPEICFHFAESLRKAERFEESILPYQKMLAVAEEYPQAVVGYGKSLLALGDFKQGWEAMEFRFISSLGSWERHKLINWVPGDTSTHVLAYSEEGIGADLMFASCLPDLINNTTHCVVECEDSLHNLFRRSFPRADFVPLADDYVQPCGNPWGIQVEKQIALGSLPRFFRQSEEDFPLRKAYLVPDREKTEQWSRQLAPLGDSKKIGLLWNGTWTNETPRQTALPLQELQNMMERYSGASWINLQHGAHQQDMDGKGKTPYLLSQAFHRDLDFMAALLTSLDLVITPPGYLAHLAGALGVRTWLLIPQGADWRHLIDVRTDEAGLGRHSMWHPTVKMYRQAKGESWQEFFAHLGRDLEKFLTTTRPPEEMPITISFPREKIIAVPKAA